MRLQSLQIKGFKSFAKDTIIYFNDNVTGIVGPNGSGKSNIIDAIRWVLGEQKSKELRLAKMQDVIFNGTKKKKAANTAEVSITFENNRGVLPSEYNFVKISRILFRSGESEYRLNDVTCRLKDIHNLLIDSGIGSNSYAIIELAMVDDILQDKDKARRKMFEQAAGISKYKKRKRETLSKLSLTQTDLDRLEDLLFEIEGNLKSLEKQAKRSRRYLKIKEDYKSSSLLYHQVMIEKLLDDKLALEKEINELTDVYSKLVVKVDKREADLQQSKLKNLNDEKQLSLFQQKLSAITDSIRKSENKKEILNNQIKYASERIQGINHRLSIIQKEVVDFESVIKNDQSKLDHEKLHLSDAKEAFDEAEKDYRETKKVFDERKTKVEAYAQKQDSLNQKIYQAEKNIAINENKLLQVDHSIVHLSEQMETEQTEKVEQGKQLEEIKNNLEHKQTTYAKLEADQKTKETKLADLNTEINQIKEAERKVLRKIDVKQNDINLLKSIINKLEGFPDSMKYLNKHWKDDKVILSDVISCDDEHRPAVELYFGNWLDYFVVDSREAAMNAIRLLKKENRGRAHFFILDEIPKVEKTHVKDEEQALYSVLQVDKKYKDLVRYLCAETLLGEPKDKALHVSVPFVDNNGTYFSKPFSLVGGSVGVFDSKKIGRKGKLKQLNKDFSKLQEEHQYQLSKLNTCETELNRWKEVNNQNEIHTLRTEMNDIQKQFYKIQSEFQSKERTLQRLESNIQLNRENKIKLTSELESLTSVLKQSKNELTEHEKQGASNAALNEISNELSQKSAKRNELNISYIKQENFVETLQKQIQFTKEKYDGRVSEIASLNKQLNKEIAKEDMGRKELKVISSELEGLYVKRKNETSDLSGVEAAYFEAKEEISNAEKEVRALQKSITELQSKVNHKKDKLTDSKYKIDGIQQRLNIEFSVNVKSLDLEVPENYDVIAQEIVIEKLKSRIANFGDVNPMAVQAYEEMEERKTNIETQRDDILSAKEQLIETIKEIESTATIKFLDAFEAVRKHFKTVFRSLFTQDDTCDLILLNPDDPLSSDIEIIAKPKGKRPQSLSQLSGGEKTLTASALLFSLYLLKPAPFCVFDEVDAPLDDHNVQKFANIIRAFSDDSQFLVVTHNKSTMAELDVLYGVYMEEKGVSSISPVDFRSLEHEPVMREAVG